MATMHVPTVTLDDLQKFHATHFLGYGNTSTDNDLNESMADDDGLGYYPDGMKRTLTDEQIKIFRHSEIYSLLREKRLREEDLTENRGKENLDNHEDTEVTVQGKQEISGTATGETMNAKKVSNGSRRPGRTSKAKHQKSDGSKSETLDYAEDDSSQGNVQTKPSPASDPRLFRRRIVSYAD